mgnify:CR=1 FL=1
MYKRVLLKLSGEALSSPDSAFDPKILKELAKELKERKHTFDMAAEGIRRFIIGLSKSVIEKCVFRNNTAKTYGGALRNNGELTIRNADDERGGCVAEIRLPTGT